MIHHSSLATDRMEEPVTNSQRHIEITVDDLPLHCPMPSMILWNAHPRVYMPIQKTGESLCPYCGTKYLLIGGPVDTGH
jgi:uncharacterized Zn-finger protein